MKSAIAKAIRFCNDIGMFCLDFPMETCVFRTQFCNANCYNRKVYYIHDTDGRVTKRDKQNNTAWKECTVEEFVEAFSRKRTRQTKRFRFGTRGEPLNNIHNIFKIRAIALAMPETIFWIPTRAWRSPLLRDIIERQLMTLPNVRVMASVDPSNSIIELAQIQGRWSTMFFGDNKQTAGRVRCVKTWDHSKAACATCDQGCFTTELIHVHLRKH